MEMYHSQPMDSIADPITPEDFKFSLEIFYKLQVNCSLRTRSSVYF